MKRTYSKDEKECIFDNDDDDDEDINEKDDIFYLPKKRRIRITKVKEEITPRPSSSSSSPPPLKTISVTPKKMEQRRCVQIIDDRKIPVVSPSGKDIEYEYVSHISELECKKENALVASFLAMNLLLNPRNVFSTSLYWISQYVNYEEKNQIHWFTDHIYKLLKHPVDFNLTSTRGISDFHSKEVKHNILLHTIGSDLHKIPTEYFIVQSNESLLRCLIYLIDPTKECFLINRSHGLKGELELSSFVYNRVMNFFYEPSFFIITSYLIYCCQLFYNSNGKDIVDYMPILDEIVEPLKLEFEIGCLSERNTNYERKRVDLLSDMKALSDIFRDNAYDTEAIIRELGKLWEERATHCFRIANVRYLELHKQLY